MLSIIWCKAISDDRYISSSQSLVLLHKCLLCLVSLFFLQHCIMIGFLCLLCSEQFGTRSKTQSLRETAHQHTWCSYPPSLSLYFSKRSYHFKSLLYHCRSDTRLPLGVALSQSLFAPLKDCRLVRLHHIRTTCNMIFLSLSTLDNLTWEQSSECMKYNSCLLFASCRSLSLREKPCYFMDVFIWGVVRCKTKKYQFSPNLDFNDFLLMYFISGLI